MSYTAIIVEKKAEEKLGIITLNRPEVRNAINQTVRAELARAIADMETDVNVRAVILTGGAKVSPPGPILRLWCKTPLWKCFQFGVMGYHIKMEESRKPFIAAIAGFCLGGGCELAMGCDIRIAAPKRAIRSAGNQYRHHSRRRRKPCGFPNSSVREKPKSLSLPEKLFLPKKRFH